jgi:hypothetical protein
LRSVSLLEPSCAPIEENSSSSRSTLASAWSIGRIAGTVEREVEVEPDDLRARRAEILLMAGILECADPPGRSDAESPDSQTIRKLIYEG